jgi:osmotically-inducible protein OsmY
MKRDIEIQKHVIEELNCVPLIKANEIGVIVKNGIVTLSGTIDSYPKKVAIEKAVKKVNGVKGIAEAIVVNLDGTHERTDSELAQAILYALEWHSAVSTDQVTILVEEAWVTVEGSVDWDFQRRSVNKVIENIIGVRGITNNITITHRPAPADIKNKILAAFIRNASVDVDKIAVSIEGNKVVLSGKVSSWAEYEEAERSVWNTSGVSVIENKLEIEDVFTIID